MKLDEQIQTYQLEENLQDLIIDVAMAVTDGEIPENTDPIVVDSYYQDAFELAAKVHHKSIREQISWLKQHGWDENEILKELVEPGDLE